MRQWRDPGRCDAAGLGRNGDALRPVRLGRFRAGTGVGYEAHCSRTQAVVHQPSVANLRARLDPVGGGLDVQPSPGAGSTRHQRAPLLLSPSRRGYLGFTCAAPDTDAPYVYKPGLFLLHHQYFGIVPTDVRRSDTLIGQVRRGQALRPLRPYAWLHECGWAVLLAQLLLWCLPVVLGTFLWRASVKRKPKPPMATQA